MRIRRADGRVCHVVEKTPRRSRDPGWFYLTLLCGMGIKHREPDWNPETKDPITCFVCMTGGKDDDQP